MLQLFRRLALAGGTVAILGLALVGAGTLGPAGSPSNKADGDAAAAADALLAADTTAGAAGPERIPAGQLRRLAAWQHLVHATATLDLPAVGGLTTVQFDHGTIGAVSSTSLTISEAGGASVTVTLAKETRVRRHGAKATIGDLAAGDDVFALSRVESDGTEAYLVVVPKA